MLATVGLLAVASSVMGALPQSATGTEPAPQATPKVVTPAIADLPAMPEDVLEAVRLMTTPRARLALRPRVSDPRRIVESSGRMGCSFSLRSIAAGIVEFLFPTAGLFHRGDPLFRLYDPAILADLTAAERALSNYDVRPLLIAAAPRLRPSQPQPQPEAAGRAVLPTDFPSPTREAAPPSLEKPTPPSKPKVIKAPPAPPKAARKPAPKPTRVAGLTRVAEPPKVDLAPFEQAMAEAQAALREAQSQVAACNEDYEARKKLVELGALAPKELEGAAATLSEAKRREADAKARLGVARERLAAEKQRAADRFAAARAAPAGGAAERPEVEVLRGSGGSQASTNVDVVRGSRESEPGAGVEVVRGDEGVSAATVVEVVRGTPGATTQARQAETVAARPKPPAESQNTSAEPVRSQPTSAPSQPGGLRYRGDTRGLMDRSFPPKPRELDRLAQQRWTEYRAPADGFVVERTVADGHEIEAGEELLRVINTQWARAYFAVATADIHRFSPGTVVSMTFDDYPDVVFEGWINSLEMARGDTSARAELIVFCRKGYYGADAFATLQWLALATPLEEHADQVAPVESVLEDSRQRHYERHPQALMSLVPQGVWTLSVDEADLKRSERLYEGQLQLVDYTDSRAAGDSDNEGRKRLSQLKRWREGFVDGMTRTIFDEKVVLTYPRSGEIRQAIERMATGRVTNIPNRCARTMREALGWGLGDAHVWARELPRRGYVARRDGLARPGDILVWPFSYPPRGTQHIGVAVQQDGRLMLLSNLAGRLGTSQILPGYVAFYNDRQARSG